MKSAATTFGGEVSPLRQTNPAPPHGFFENNPRGPRGLAVLPTPPSAGGYPPQRPPTCLVFVHAHPDDETLWTGGLIATAAQAGARVIVVTCTRGERGEVLTLPGTASEHEGWRQGDPAALAEYRTGELHRALAALAEGAPAGIEHHFLDELPLSPGSVASAPRLAASPQTPTVPEVGSRYEDSGMAWVAPGVAGPDPNVATGFATVPLDEAAGRLANLLTQLHQADPTDDIVVVTYEKGGGYGHPDHVKAHEVAARGVELTQTKDKQKYAVALDAAWEQGALACAANPLQSVPPKPIAIWEAVIPRAEFVSLTRTLASDPAVRAYAQSHGLTVPGLPASAGDMPASADELAAAASLPPMVLPAGEAPDIEVPVEPVLSNLIAAMRQYATQIQAVQAFHGFAGQPGQPGQSGPSDQSGQSGPSGQPGQSEQPGLAALGILGTFALSNGVVTPIRATETYRIATAT